MKKLLTIMALLVILWPNGAKAQSDLQIDTSTKWTPMSFLVVSSGQYSSRIEFDLSGDTLTAKIRGNVDSVAESFIFYVVEKYNGKLSKLQSKIDSLENLLNQVYEKPAIVKWKPTSKQEKPDWLISTDSIPPDTLPEYWKGIQIGVFDSPMLTFADPELGKITKDTIEVKALCEKVNRSGLFFTIEGIETRWLTMERTFEVQRIPTPPNSGVFILATTSVQISSRYLDDTNGCYHLQPIKNNER